MRNEGPSLVHALAGAVSKGLELLLANHCDGAGQLQLPSNARSVTAVRISCFALANFVDAWRGKESEDISSTLKQALDKTGMLERLAAACTALTRTQAAASADRSNSSSSQQQPAASLSAGLLYLFQHVAHWSPLYGTPQRRAIEANPYSALVPVCGLALAVLRTYPGATAAACRAHSSSRSYGIVGRDTDVPLEECWRIAAQYAAWIAGDVSCMLAGSPNDVSALLQALKADEVRILVLAHVGLAAQQMHQRSAGKWSAPASSRAAGSSGRGGGSRTAKQLPVPEYHLQLYEALGLSPALAAHAAEVAPVTKAKAQLAITSTAVIAKLAGAATLTASDAEPGGAGSSASSKPAVPLGVHLPLALTMLELLLLAEPNLKEVATGLITMNAMMLVIISASASAVLLPLVLQLLLPAVMHVVESAEGAAGAAAGADNWQALALGAAAQQLGVLLYLLVGADYNAAIQPLSSALQQQPAAMSKALELAVRGASRTVAPGGARATDVHAMLPAVTQALANMLAAADGKAVANAATSQELFSLLVTCMKVCVKVVGDMHPMLVMQCACDAAAVTEALAAGDRAGASAAGSRSSTRSNSSSSSSSSRRIRAGTASAGPCTVLAGRALHLIGLVMVAALQQEAAQVGPALGPPPAGYFTERGSLKSGFAVLVRCLGSLLLAKELTSPAAAADSASSQQQQQLAQKLAEMQLSMELGGPLDAEAAGKVAQELKEVGAAVCSQAPSPLCCNNPGCTCMAMHSELQLVGGKACHCSGCKVARYCCKECQIAHWKQHKQVCAVEKQKAAGTASSTALKPKA